MTKEEFLDSFFAQNSELRIHCASLEQRTEAVDLLLPYAPNRDLTYVSYKFPACEWQSLGWNYGEFALWRGIVYAIPFQEFLEIMESESAEESLTFGDALEGLL